MAGEDARLFLQNWNSIFSELTNLINPCKFVKKLMDYLVFYILRKRMSPNVWAVQGFYPPKKQDSFLTAYYLEFNKIYKSWIYCCLSVSISKLNKLIRNKWQLWVPNISHILIHKKSSINFETAFIKFDFPCKFKSISYYISSTKSEFGFKFSNSTSMHSATLSVQNIPFQSKTNWKPLKKGNFPSLKPFQKISFEARLS